MSILRRFFRIGTAEVHAGLDKLEDATKMTDQGIRELKEQLQKSLNALAQLKSMVIQSQREQAEAKEKVSTYQNKAESLANGIKAGKVDAEEGKKAAIECLNSKKIAESDVARLENDIIKQQANVDKMSKNIDVLKQNITKWENEAKTLKSRQKVAEATTSINKQLAGVDPNDTLAMLEKMKSKVDEQEALSESYAEIANTNVSLDQKVDNLLKNVDSTGDAEFEALMAK